MSVAKVFRPIVAMDTQRLYEPGISPSHCRNLFGPVDHEQVRTELEEELRRIVEEKERRWNFDFVNERPLAGDFLWQRIGDNRTVGFSTIAAPTESPSALQAPVVDTDNSTAPTCEESQEPTTQSPSNSKVNCMKTPERIITKPQRRSPRITDYLRGRKKSATSREIKFSRHAGDDRLTTKQVRTGRSHGRGRTSKQSTLDELLPKLRPRHASGKTSS